MDGWEGPRKKNTIPRPAKLPFQESMATVTSAGLTPTVPGMGTVRVISMGAAKSLSSKNRSPSGNVDGLTRTPSPFTLFRHAITTTEPGNPVPLIDPTMVTASVSKTRCTYAASGTSGFTHTSVNKSRVTSTQLMVSGAGESMRNLYKAHENIGKQLPSGCMAAVKATDLDLDMTLCSWASFPMPLPCSSFDVSNATHAKYLSSGAQNDVYVRVVNGKKCVLKCARPLVCAKSFGDYLSVDGFVRHKNLVRELLHNTGCGASFPSAFFTMSGRICSVMPFIAGEQLLTWAQRVRDADEIVRVEAQILHALCELRSRGVCHNDVHSQNIMITKLVTSERVVQAACIRNAPRFVFSTRYVPVLVDWDRCATRRDSACGFQSILASSMMGHCTEFGDLFDYVARTLRHDGSHMHPTFMLDVARRMGVINRAAVPETACARVDAVLR